MSVMEVQSTPHPIRIVADEDLRLSRLTVFFRLLLAIPHLIWLALWSIAVFFAAIAGWFAALFTGRLPEGIHGFIARYLRYSTHVNAYMFIVANPFPAFSATAGYPVDLEVDPPVAQSRLTILFRLLLVIPAYIFASILNYLLQLLAFIAWVFGIFAGRAIPGIRGLEIYCLRFMAQSYGYALLLTGKYPNFGD
jgi:hypothetical protein